MKPTGVVEPDGAPDRLSPTVLDALRESESRLAVVLERLDDLVLYETGGGREFISPNVVHLTGYSAEELTADRAKFPSLIHPDDVPSVMERVRQWHEQGSIGVLMSRFRLLRPDGECVWIEDRMVQVVPENGPAYMTGVLVDVTLRREAEEQMRANEDRSTALLSALPDSIFVMDRQGVYLDYHTPPGARLIAPPEEFLGRRMCEVMNHPDVGEHQRHLERAIDQRTMQMFEYQRGHSSDQRHYEVRMVPCGTDRVLAIVRDISSRKRAEQAYRQSVERQHLVLSELDHRIRNNLAALISLIDLTAQDESQTVSSFAATLRSRVRAMSSAHTLLSKVQWNPPRLDELLRSIIPDDLKVRIASDGPEIRVSPRQAIPLAMVIQELIFNSIKYGSLSSCDGRVEIEWNAAETESPDGDVQIEMEWRERGGPPPQQSPRLGAGASLVSRLVASELRGRIDLAYPRAGASHVLALALDRV